MPARDELNRQWQANEAELNRLHSMRKLVDIALYRMAGDA
jgi:hypothetical protein